MHFPLSIVTILALGASAYAQSLLQPVIVGDMIPIASTPLESLVTKEPVKQIAEPEPGQFYLFFESEPSTPAKKTSNAKPAPASVTRVYHSTDRQNFGEAEKNADALRLVAKFPMVGAKVVKHDGKWFIAGRRPGSSDMSVAPLEWKPIAKPATAISQKPGGHIRVALYDDPGSFGKGVAKVSEQLGRCDDIEVTVLNSDGIRSGLSGYDVVIFTGGSGSAQANSIGLLGREQVRRFVEAGGGYIGICAGAYLACDGYAWGVKVLDAKTPSPKWLRGKARLDVEAMPEAQKTLGLPQKSVIVYANGPVLAPGNNPDIPDYEPLVLFRSETAENDSPAGLQINSPAMVRSAFGKGRVIVSSPHPEQTDGMENWIEHAVRAVAPGP